MSNHIIAEHISRKIAANANPFRNWWGSGVQDGVVSSSTPKVDIAVPQPDGSVPSSMQSGSSSSGKTSTSTSATTKAAAIYGNQYGLPAYSQIRDAYNPYGYGNPYTQYQPYQTSRPIYGDQPYGSQSYSVQPMAPSPNVPQVPQAPDRTWGEWAQSQEPAARDAQKLGLTMSGPGLGFRLLMPKTFNRVADNVWGATNTVSKGIRSALGWANKRRNAVDSYLSGETNPVDIPSIPGAIGRSITATKNINRPTTSSAASAASRASSGVR